MNPSPGPSGGELAADPTDPAGPTALGVSAEAAADAAGRLVAALDRLAVALGPAIPPGSLAAPDRPAGGRSLPAARALAARVLVAAGRWSDDVDVHADAVRRGLADLAAADEAGARELRGGVPR